MISPWLSIISPIYNGEKYLRSALDSIVIQDDQDIECIAVDGESTDSTLSILESYQDKLPLRILQRERSSNWVSKTNYALSFAQGEYVCFLHHDDLWFPNRLRIMRRLAGEFPDAVLLLHPSNYFDTLGNIVGLWSCPLPPYPEIIKSELMIERLLIQNFISILGPAFKRSAVSKAGDLDEALWYTADWDFWLKIASCGETIYWPKPLSGFRIHSNSQTIVQSLHAGDFRNQLEVVANKYLSLLETRKKINLEIQRVAEFSIEVNIALAGSVHGEKPNIISLLVSFARLGLTGWYRYIRDSRIMERVTARLRAQLVRPNKKH